MSTMNNSYNTENQTIVLTTTTTEEIAAQDIVVRYVYDSETPVAETETITRTSYKWKFNLTENEPVVPGSVILDASGEYWFDDSAGHIVRTFSTETGVGTTIG
ncbi:hypothetical protein, partial [Saccharospirillum sp. MSK14-1]|uniref:hypothetical protein n=1 Tax=Saccharospirillum sp. MSK14-1 TaxID=1897632 RepID=UPI0011B21BC4